MNRYCYECKKDDTITVIDMKDGEEYNLPTPEVLGYLDYLTNGREIKSKIDTCKELNNCTSYSTTFDTSIDISEYDELDFTEVMPDTNSTVSFRGKECYIKPSHRQKFLELRTCDGVLDLTHRSDTLDTLFLHPSNMVKFPKKPALSVTRLSFADSGIKHSGRLKEVSELYYSGTVAEFNKLVRSIDKIKELKAVIFYFDGGGKKSATLKIPKQLENNTYLNARVTTPKLKLTLDLQNQEVTRGISIIFEQHCPLKNRASFEIDVIVQNVNCKTRQDFKKLKKRIYAGMRGQKAKCTTTYLTTFIEIPKNLIGEVRADCQDRYVSKREEYNV